MKTTIEQIPSRETIGQTCFVICGSCYWCASVFSSNRLMMCPSCQNANLDSMPIGSDEAYVFKFEEGRGVTLDFVQVRRK